MPAVAERLELLLERLWKLPSPPPTAAQRLRPQQRRLWRQPLLQGAMGTLAWQPSQRWPRLPARRPLRLPARGLPWPSLRQRLPVLPSP